jgi:hypothetical protein
MWRGAPDINLDGKGLVDKTRGMIDCGVRLQSDCEMSSAHHDDWIGAPTPVPQSNRCIMGGKKVRQGHWMAGSRCPLALSSAAAPARQERKTQAGQDASA